MKYGADYYGKLYESKNISEDLINSYLNELPIGNTLSQLDRDICEGLVTKCECDEVLRHIKKTRPQAVTGYQENFM